MNEKEIWDNTHGTLGYSNKVFSLLDSDLVLNKFESELMEFRGRQDSLRILIPGCGSNVNLQVCCNKVFGDSAIIYALDWSREAIEISKQQTDKLKIDVKYINQSYYDMSLDSSSFDLILMSNAIVSETLENNTAALTNLSKLLKPGGCLLGLLPSPFNMLDYALTNADANHWLEDGTVNIRERRIYERGFCMQRFFSPLELHVLLKRIGCCTEKFELFFYDDENFARQISTLYDINYNNEYCFWGYFIKTKKI